MFTGTGGNWCSEARKEARTFVSPRNYSERGNLLSLLSFVIQNNNKLEAPMTLLVLIVQNQYTKFNKEKSHIKGDIS